MTEKVHRLEIKPGRALNNLHTHCQFNFPHTFLDSMRTEVTKSAERVAILKQRSQLDSLLRPLSYVILFKLQKRSRNEYVLEQIIVTISWLFSLYNTVTEMNMYIYRG